jgi:hypothetical protein
VVAPDTATSAIYHQLSFHSNRGMAQHNFCVGCSSKLLSINGTVVRTPCLPLHELRRNAPHHLSAPSRHKLTWKTQPHSLHTRHQQVYENQAKPSVTLTYQAISHVLDEQSNQRPQQGDSDICYNTPYANIILTQDGATHPRLTHQQTNHHSTQAPTAQESLSPGA